MNRYVKFLCSTACIASLSACQHLADKPVPSATGIAITDLSDLPDSWASVSEKAGPVRNDWLNAFSDPLLIDLVEEAQKNNQDLELAATQVEIAAAYSREAYSHLKPGVAVTGGASRGRIGLDGFGNFGIPETTNRSTTYGLVQLSWEIDLWGRLRDGWLSASENEKAALADYQAAQQSIAAAVARSYFVILETSAQEKLLEESRATLLSLRKLVALQLEAGVANEVDLSKLDSRLAQIDAQVTSLQAGRRKAIRALEVLLGRYPSATLETATGLPDVPLPPPAGLPSSLLERRPDIRSAEHKVAAALFSRERAHKVHLPQFSLTGLLGVASDDLLGMLDPSTTLLNLGGSLAAPLYQGGAVKAGEDIADARLRLAITSYQKSALSAFREVEDALDEGVSLRQQKRDIEIAIAASREALRLETLRYEVGESDLVDVLLAEQDLIDVKSNLLEIERRLRDQYIVLNLALGGSWTSEELPISQQETK